LQSHAGNALAVIATRLLPGPLGCGHESRVTDWTLATLQAAVISAARVGFADVARRVMRGISRRVDPRTGNLGPQLS